MSPIFCVEDGVVELRHHAAALREAEFAAGVLAAGVVGILLGQLGPVAAGLKLLGDVLGLGLGGRVGLGVGVGAQLDEDVARARLLGNLVLGLVLVVVGLNLLLRGLRNAAGKLVGRERKVGDLALLRHRVRVARGVLLEEGLEIGVRRVDGLAQIVAREHRVIELDLDVVLAVGVADFLVADR